MIQEVPKRQTWRRVIKLGEGLPIEDGLACHEPLVVVKVSEDVRSEVR